MLTPDQQQGLHRYLIDEWLSVSYPPLTDEGIVKLIATIYNQLDYDPPAVVWCEGPLHYLMFPVLISAMATVGLQACQQTGFRRLGTDRQDVVKAWDLLWQEAVRALASDDRDAGKIINRKMSRAVLNLVKARLENSISRKLGPTYDLIENEIRTHLFVPIRNFELATCYNEADLRTLWKSFLSRVPEIMVTTIGTLSEEILSQRISESDDRQANAGGRDRPVNLRTDFRQSWFGLRDWQFLACAEYANKYLNCELPLTLSSQLSDWLQLALSTSAIMFFERRCFVYRRPSQIHFDEQWRVHKQGQAAVRFRDGTKLFFWHGTEVPELAITAPRKMQLKSIESEPNIEVRRALIECYGLDNFIKESGARIIHQDCWGVLYRVSNSGDEPVVAVKVLNATPEPDGQFKTYFIRVPPSMERARQAIAWSFGMDEEEYEPQTET